MCLGHPPRQHRPVRPGTGVERGRRGVGSRRGRGRERVRGRGWIEGGVGDGVSESEDGGGCGQPAPRPPGSAAQGWWGSGGGRGAEAVASGAGPARRGAGGRRWMTGFAVLEVARGGRPPAGPVGVAAVGRRRRSGRRNRCRGRSPRTRPGLRRSGRSTARPEAAASPGRPTRPARPAGAAGANGQVGDRGGPGGGGKGRDHPAGTSSDTVGEHLPGSGVGVGEQRRGQDHGRGDPAAGRRGEGHLDGVAAGQAGDHVEAEALGHRQVDVGRGGQQLVGGAMSSDRMPTPQSSTVSTCAPGVWR
jgi:hypothetical protein